jgi:hypothetical protein
MYFPNILKSFDYITWVPACRFKKYTEAYFYVNRDYMNDTKYVIKMDAMDPAIITLRFEQAGTQDFS